MCSFWSVLLRLPCVRFPRKGTYVALVTYAIKRIVPFLWILTRCKKQTTTINSINDYMYK